MTVKISIIIPHYNRPELFLDTFSSIVNQSCRDFECIVVDDGSEETKFESIQRVIKSDPRFSLHRRMSPLKGANSCRNEGALMSKGNYLIFLDSDDVLHRDCLLMRLRAIEASGNADCLIFKMGKFEKIVGDSDEVVNRFTDENSTKKLLRYFLAFNLPWPITAAIWRRQFFEIILFDDKLSRFQDLDIHIHALTRVSELVLYPHAEVDCYYRKSTYHETADLMQLRKVLEDGIYLLKKWSKVLSSEDARFLTGLILFLCRNYAKVIELQDVQSLYRFYLALGNKRFGNLNAELTILLSHNGLNWLPFIDPLRKRFYYFGKLPFRQLELEP